MGRACGREHCVSLLLVNCMLYTLISTYICQRLLLLLLLGGSVKHAVCIALTVALNPGMESPAALRAASPRPPWSRTPPGDWGGPGRPGSLGAPSKSPPLCSVCKLPTCAVFLLNVKRTRQIFLRRTRALKAGPPDSQERLPLTDTQPSARSPRPHSGASSPEKPRRGPRSRARETEGTDAHFLLNSPLGSGKPRSAARPPARPLALPGGQRDLRAVLLLSAAPAPSLGNVMLVSLE